VLLTHIIPRPDKMIMSNSKTILVVTFMAFTSAYIIIDDGRHTQFYSPFALNTDNKYNDVTGHFGIPQVIHAPVITMNNLIYIIGGFRSDDEDKSFKTSDRVYAFDPSTNKTTRLADLNEVRSNFAAAPNNNLITVCGGGDYVEKTCEQYDATKNVWTYITDFPFDTSSHMSLTLLNATYIFGGDFGGEAQNQVFKLEAGGTKWIKVANMPSTLTDGAAINLDDGTALICGGFTSNEDSSATNACNVYSAKTDTWKSAEFSLRAQRAAFTLVRYTGRLWAIGGWVSSEGYLSVAATVEVLNEANPHGWHPLPVDNHLETGTFMTIAAVSV
jgi:hypothetical protein